MVDHQELMSELPLLEKLSTQDRLKLARKRRMQQLKRFSQYEKQLEKDKKDNKKRKSSQIVVKKQRTSNRIRFVNSVMLLEAAARNDIEEVRQLLEMGVSGDVTNEDGLTALHQCCIDDNENMMQLLIEYGANVNAQDSELWTPLHAAATCGHVHLCQYLIEQKANLLAVNADGNMPYDICEDETTLDFIENEMAKKGITQELIDETRLSTEKTMLNDIRHSVEDDDIDLNQPLQNGATLLHIAAANGYEEVAKFLLDRKVRVDGTDNDSWQPVHAAACWGQPVILELLIRHGADIDAKTKNGETPMDICEDAELRQRIVEIKEEIANHGMKPKSSLSRSRSTNTRSMFTSKDSLYSSNPSLNEISTHHSASIRRSSMRDKSMMSWKEAREEARLREMNATKEREEEGEKKEDVVPGVPTVEVTKPDDVHIEVKEEPRVRRTSATHPPPAPPILDSAPSMDEPAPPTPCRSKNDRRAQNHLDSMLTPGVISDEHKGDIILGAQLSQHSAPATPMHRFPSDERLSERLSRSSRDEDSQYSLKERTGSMDLRAAASAAPSAGTLAELKRQRMQQHINNRKPVDKEADLSRQSSGQSVDSASTNGNTPLLDGKTKVSNSDAKTPIAAYGDRPIKKFKAQETEVVGGDEVKPRCCTIL